jgi:hypothetical protein
MKLFASSLIRNAKGWIDSVPEKEHKDVQEFAESF